MSIKRLLFTKYKAPANLIKSQVVYTLLYPFTFEESTTGNTYNESVTLSFQKGYSLLSDCVLSVSVSLSRVNQYNTGTIADFLSSLVLSRIIQIQTESSVEVGGNVYDEVISISRLNTVTLSIAADLIDSLLLGRVVQTTESGLVNLTSSVLLNRSNFITQVSNLTLEQSVALLISRAVSSSSNLSVSVNLDLTRLESISADSQSSFSVQLELSKTNSIITLSGLSLEESVSLLSNLGLSFGGLVFVFGETPVSRIVVIHAENRILDIRFENRTINVEHENRNINIETETRLVQIEREVRVSSEVGIMRVFEKHPDAVKDYKFDWKAKTNGTGASDWLSSSETISTAEVIVPNGITLESYSITDSGTTVTAWISGGSDGFEYEVSCKITTSAGRTEVMTIKIKVGTTYA